MIRKEVSNNIVLTMTTVRLHKNSERSAFVNIQIQSSQVKLPTLCVMLNIHMQTLQGPFFHSYESLLSGDPLF